MSAALMFDGGTAYVNDFNFLGRTYRVTAQAEAGQRQSVDEVGKYVVKNRDGGLVPLSSVATFSDRTGPYRVERYNLYPAAAIQGAVAPGFSTGYGLDRMEAIAAEVLLGLPAMERPAELADQVPEPGVASPSKGSLRWVRSIGERGRGRLMVDLYVRRSGAPTAQQIIVVPRPRSEWTAAAHLGAGWMTKLDANMGRHVDQLRWLRALGPSLG